MKVIVLHDKCTGEVDVSISNFKYSFNFLLQNLKWKQNSNLE